MVDEDIAGRDIHDARVLDAMKRVPRHAFVPFDWQEQAYTDRPLPIGHEQTISQPYIVALMTELAEPERDDRALDVGTGSGYQAAILAELVDQVYSIEIVPELAEEAKDRLHDQGYENISFRIGDGFQGWPEAAPFDLIILAAAAAEVPPALIDQLAPGGRMVLPVGDRFGQKLLMIKKDSRGEIERRVVAPVSFVPMTGQARQPKP
jgi:protein-L-isoaspartate(D-aspartate) O-methyltransferase